MTEDQLEKRREKWRRYYYRHPERQKARRVKSQQSNAEYIDSFKTSCMDCGNSDSRVLDFHHKDDSSKLFTLASRRVAGYAKGPIKEEIDKCEVLCANCHRIRHWEDHNENE